MMWRRYQRGNQDQESQETEKMMLEEQGVDTFMLKGSV